ncbi:AzlC family ABC transporter permease [Thalassococcus sp. BH17M4-6]|uniref:AzlC family ABC transporter permease n=1 Tax=Thalassococcus sp. BH17M4-6 TaxID=3413148 RepID=UPI003BD2CF1C
MTTLSQVRVSDSLMAGARGVLPVAIVVVPVGLAFGAAAVAKGMTPAEATLLSLLAFTASAQFAALDFFGGKLHLLPVLMVMFAVSSRHLIMGATLYPSLQALPRWRQYRSLAFLSDPNYADTMRASRQDRSADLTRLMGGGMMLWMAWVAGTFAGSLAGSSFSDLSRFGVDVILVSYFTTVVMDTPEEERIYPILGLVAVTAYLGHFLMPDGWNIVAAALVGGAARWMTAND